MSLIKNINLELFKLKHRYFYFTWFLLTIPILGYMLYDMRNMGPSTLLIYQNLNSYYFDYLLKAQMLMGLLMPVCAGILISKLVDQEHKADNWKLLLTSNSSFYELWYAKFLVVYFLMEVTTLAVYLLMTFDVYFQLHYPIPLQQLCINFLATSGVNFMILTIAEYFSVYFKNQLVVLTVSLITGFIGIISPLMPQEVVKFIPWGYYTLCSLCRTEMAGLNEAGRNIYRIVNITPPYILILSVIILFVLLNFLLAYLKSNSEV